jgi:MFS family permease
MCDHRSVNVRAGFLGNGALVRSLLSFGFAFTAEWAFTVAIGLVAFADGGAVAVGLVGLLRLLPAALLAPAITAYADRMPRERVLFASSAVRGVATLAAAPVLLAGGPTVVVYALAVVSTVAFTPFRASHSALMPSLCRTPDELTSVNVVRGALDSVSLIVGPLVAALLVAVADVAAVFLFAGACGLVSGALVVRLNYERIRIPTTGRRPLLTEVREGLAAVASNAGVGVVVGFVVLQAAIRGAFTVFVVVVAIDLLDGGQSSVGVLQGAVGIGALAGSTLCTLLIGSRAMTRWLGVAVVLWGAPLAMIGLLPSYVTALLAAGVIGIGNAMVDVTAFTLVARMAPNAVLARVFGVLESWGAIAVGIGSLVAPLLMALLGTQGALVAVGAVTPVVCLLWWRRLTAIDRSVAVRTDDIILLRQVPMLRPLPVPVLEQLARGLHRTELRPDEAVFEAGDTGDSYHVVADGTVHVLDHGQVVRTMGKGEGFGEIALLGNTTRTMTVRAVGHVQLYGISSAVFLPAVMSISEARSAAEATTLAYLAHAPGTAVENPDAS